MGGPVWGVCVFMLCVRDVLCTRDECAELQCASAVGGALCPVPPEL